MALWIDEVGATDHTPERQLACAVLERALIDLNSTVGVGSNSTREHEVETARLFLTEQTGRWARARTFWLDMAGIDPEAFASGLKENAHARRRG